MGKFKILETDLSTFENSWYWNSYNKAGKIKLIFWFLFNRIFINTYLPIPIFIKRIILEFFGAVVGKNVVIKPKVNIKFPWLLEIGENTWIGEKVWIDNFSMVKIGKNVCLSQGALLISGNHNFSKTTFDLVVKPIIIEDGVWIGAKGTVCQGVICKSHSVLLVGSVATSDLDTYSIYRGNPAIFVKRRVVS